MKKLMVAVPVLAIAMSGSTALAQTYKPDFATKIVATGAGNSITNTTTITGSSTSPLTWTLPPDNGASAHYFMMNDGTGTLTWSDPSAFITLAGDVTGAANANTVVKLRGVSLNADMATPADANIMVYNSTGTSWHAVGTSGDVTMDHSGVTAIGASKVTSTMILDGTIVNADVNAAAAIAGTKISPDFGAQAVTTTGNISATGSGTITSAGLLTASNALTVTSGNITTPLAAGVLHSSGAATALTSTLIVNADVSATAAIAGTKISPDFGSQAVTTSGNISTTGSGTITSAGLLTASAGATVTGTATLGQINLTPGTITIDATHVNNVAVAATSTYFYLAPDAARSVTGLTGGVDGRILIVVNNTANAVTINNENSSSTAANRFHLQGASDIIIASDGTATFAYDGTISRWRMISAQ